MILADPQHPAPPPDGMAESHQCALACADLWLAALRCYYSDCRSAYRGINPNSDSEALDDLTGSRELLANLCRPMDADPVRLAELMLETLKTGKRWTLDATLKTGKMTRR